jgi:hypothetical protein
MNGRSGLQDAQEGDGLDTIGEILQLEAARNYSDFGFSSSLTAAAKAGKAGIVNRRLRANADFTNKSLYGIDASSLEAVAEGGHFGVV